MQKSGGGGGRQDICKGTAREDSSSPSAITHDHGRDIGQRRMRAGKGLQPLRVWQAQVDRSTSTGANSTRSIAVPESIDGRDGRISAPAAQSAERTISTSWAVLDQEDF